MPMQMYKAHGKDFHSPAVRIVSPTASVTTSTTRPYTDGSATTHPYAAATAPTHMHTEESELGPQHDDGNGSSQSPLQATGSTPTHEHTGTAAPAHLHVSTTAPTRLHTEGSELSPQHDDGNGSSQSPPRVTGSTLMHENAENTENAPPAHLHASTPTLTRMHATYSAPTHEHTGTAASAHLPVSSTTPTRLYTEGSELGPQHDDGNGSSPTHDHAVIASPAHAHPSTTTPTHVYDDGDGCALLHTPPSGCSPANLCTLIRPDTGAVTTSHQHADGSGTFEQRTNDSPPIHIMHDTRQTDMRHDGSSSPHVVSTNHRDGYVSASANTHNEVSALARLPVEDSSPTDLSAKTHPTGDRLPTSLRHATSPASPHQLDKTNPPHFRGPTAPMELDAKDSSPTRPFANGSPGGLATTHQYAKASASARMNNEISVTGHDHVGGPMPSNSQHRGPSINQDQAISAKHHVPGSQESRRPPPTQVYRFLSIEPS